MNPKAAVGGSEAVPVEPEAPEERGFECVRCEVGGLLDSFLQDLDGVRELGMPSGQVDRNRDHYPGDRASTIFTLGDMGEEMTRRFVRLQSRTRRIVRGAVPMPSKWDPRYKASLRRSGPMPTANELKAFAIDGACRIMQHVREDQNPPWMELILATRRRECPDVPDPLPIPIDGVREVRSDSGLYENRKEFRFTMHSPSIRNFNERRASYVAEVAVTFPAGESDAFLRSAEFSILVFDDCFEIDVQTQPGPRVVRDVRIPPDGRRSQSWRPSSDVEKAALESLREMISEEEFRKYLKRGFISVRGRSGKDYQIFRDRWHAKVRMRGRVVAEVCSRIKDDHVPMTDNVIAFKTMIEADEAEFERAGNVYRMTV